MFQMDMPSVNPPQRELPHHHRGVNRGAPQICDAKKPAIVHAMVAHGANRFDQLVTVIPIARNILSARLSAMVTDGLAEKVPQRIGSSRHFYLPTDKARALGDLILVAASHDAKSPVHRHDGCGKSRVSSVACGACLGAGSSGGVDAWTQLGRVTPAEVSAWFTKTLGSTAAVAQVAHDQWSTRILSCLHQTHDDGNAACDTFDQLVNHLGIARNILADRLKTLVAAGLVSREPYQVRPERHRYRPTPAADSALGFLSVLGEWGHVWAGASDARPRHGECGGGFRPVLSCDACTSV
jgi:DNA-binding HxlR family transcriptional regulator